MGTRAKPPIPHTSRAQPLFKAQFMNNQEKNQILSEIKVRIKEQRISRTYISDQTGISEGALSEFLNGKRDISWHKFTHLCQIIRYRIIKEAAPESLFMIVRIKYGSVLFWSGSMWTDVESDAQLLTYTKAEILNSKFDNQYRIISAW